MEVKISEKYAQELLSGMKQACLRQTKSGTQFVGAIKFRLFDTDTCWKKIEISLWPEGAEEPMFTAKESFLMSEDSTFTFEPFTLGIGFDDEDIIKDEVEECSTCRFWKGGSEHWHCTNSNSPKELHVTDQGDDCIWWSEKRESK